MSKIVLRIIQISLGIFAILGLLISVIAFYSYFFYKLPTKENLVTISGEVERYDKRETSGDEDYLDIFLINNPIRFRIDINQYKNYFKSESFFVTVKPGSKINIEVNEEALSKPFIPPADPVKTVFIETIWDDSNVYSVWEDRIKWQIKNRGYALYVGIAFLIGTIFLALCIFILLPKFILQKL